MSTDSKTSHWQIQISDEDRSYRQTKDLHVLAPRMIDAINRVMNLYPNCVVYNCSHKGTFKDELYVRPKASGVPDDTAQLDVFNTYLFNRIDGGQYQDITVSTKNN